MGAVSWCRRKGGIWLWQKKARTAKKKAPAKRKTAAKTKAPAKRKTAAKTKAPAKRKAAAKTKAPSKSSEKIEKEKLKKSRRRDRRRVLDTVLKFRNFLGCSFEPQIEDTEIFVCFADIRGFTEYCRTLQKEMQDRKVQNFLKSYVKIFNEGLLDWFVDNTDANFQPIKRNRLEILDLVIPTYYKNLGDGAMLVWEVPPSLGSMAQGILAQEIISLVENIEGRFNRIFVESLSPVQQDALSQHVQKLKIGFGVAKGHAWRLDYGTHTDYAGSVINLAARLESMARPTGTIFHYDMSPWIFDQLVDDDSGKIVEITGIKGYGSIKAYVDETIDFTQPGFKILR